MAQANKKSAEIIKLTPARLKKHLQDQMLLSLRERDQGFLGNSDRRFLDLVQDLLQTKNDKELGDIAEIACLMPVTVRRVSNADHEPDYYPRARTLENIGIALGLRLTASMESVNRKFLPEVHRPDLEDE